MNNNVKSFDDVLALSLDKFAFLVNSTFLDGRYDFHGNEHKQHVVSRIDIDKLKNKWEELAAGIEPTAKSNFFSFNGDKHQVKIDDARNLFFEIQEGAFPVWILNEPLGFDKIVESVSLVKENDNAQSPAKLNLDYIEHKRRELKENREFVHYVFSIYCETEPAFLSYLCDKPLPKLGGFLHETIYNNIAKINSRVFLLDKGVNAAFAEAIESIKHAARALEKDPDNVSSRAFLRHSKSYIRNALSIDENGVESLQDALYVSQHMLDKDSNTARKFFDIRDLAQMGINNEKAPF